jgi:rubredoxin
MLHESQEISFRKLVRVEGQSFAGWGCSECGWVFNPSGPPVGESLDAMKRNFQLQLSDEFVSHACAQNNLRRRALAKAANGLP